jgi:predicted phage terminase large subunit-like protein
MSDIGFDKRELETLLQNVDALDDAEIIEVERMLEELDKRARLKAAKDDLIAFCQWMDPNYKVGRHHRLLADQLMAIERGEKDRVCVNIPPRHGKSQLVSTYYPAWFIGRNAGKKVMLVSHTADLAVDFGRKVRNIIDSEPYQQVFPNLSLSSDSKSAGRWTTSTGCEFYATGVGSALAGRGADLLLVDDPHSEQDVLNGNFSAFDKAYDWFAFGARTRLMPRGRVAIVHCMTGDTGVLMSDGTEKALRDVRPGDMVASYKDGALVSKKILNWASQGLDCVYAINTTCGKTVRANERHPFLVDRGGELTWTKVRDLRPGDSLVSLRDARALRGPRQNPENAKRANPRIHGIESIQTHRAEGRTIGGSSVESSVLPKDAKLRRTLEAYASATITKLCGLLGRGIVALTKIATPISNIGTASRSPNIAGCGMRRAESAPFMVVRRGLTTLLLTGKGSWRSTIATTLREFEHSSATRATSSLGMGPRKISSCGLFSTSKIISIVPDGDEEVFDIQVEDTENFIANGVVSHNTRWHANDMTGRLIQDMTNNEGSDQYEVVEYPAILEVEDKATGEIVQKALWPEFFDLPALLRTKASMPVFQWNAQYQQNPTGEEASIIKRDWWRLWPDDDPPAVEYVIMALDAAAEANNRADFTSLTTWGVFFNEEENMHQIILLNAIKRRMEFPELKQLSMEEYREWEPDAFIVEKKSSGTPLYQEMRRAGVMAQEYTPVRGTANNPNSKMARLNSVSDIISSGLVWVPPKRWAEELVEEVAGFPFAPNDDQVDTTIMALMRFRQGGFIKLPTDEQDEELPYRRKVDYY